MIQIYVLKEPGEPLAVRCYTVPVQLDGVRYKISGEPTACAWADEETAFTLMEEYLDGPNPSHADVPVPDGWELVGSAILPDNFVPPSREVKEEGERRAMDFLRKKGFWKDA
jgi:hypothetical protein